MKSPQAPALSLTLDHDAFPCGAALQAVRSPRASAASSLGHCDSTASSGNLSSGSTVDGDGSSADDNNDDGQVNQAAATSTSKAPQLATPTSKAADLARRSQQRVTDRRRSEQERREEEELRRRTRSERDRQERDQAARLKTRRRAEIYALNAILRELQQRKIAAYIEAQRTQQQVQAQSAGERGEQVAEVVRCSAIGV